MDSAHTASALSQVLALTQAMLQRAEQQHWDEIVIIEQQRQIAIESIFPIEQKNMTAQIQASIQEIIDLNHDLESKCSQAKHKMQLEIQGLSQNKKAVAAYSAK